MSASANDAADSFCYSEASGFFDELGTPGQPNSCGKLCTENGGLRPVVQPKVGDLLFNEVFPNPTGADRGRDWVEIYVKNAVDLHGVVLSYESPGGGSGSWTLAPQPADPCLAAPAGSYAVIGGPNVAGAGVVALATVGGGTDTLLPANPGTAGDLVLRLLSAGVLLDESNYPQIDDPLRPLPEGRSFARQPDASHTDGASCSWCVAPVAVGGFNDLSGSPGASNPEGCLPAF